MTTSDMFTAFLENLKIDNSEQISDRYGEITASLNKRFRDTESKTANSLQVGSYGRYTGIKGISDLDMLYIMPKGEWDTYKDGGQGKLLTDTKDAIKARYPKTEIKVDSPVVTVTYTNFHVEVQPVFEEEDENGNIQYKFPDTSKGGRWRITKPKQEISAMKDFIDQKNKNLRKLCKMARAWKNKHGVCMGGLLIDTLAHNFLKSTNAYDNKGAASYGEMCRDFFEFLMNQLDQDHYQALGSGQDVKVKKKFQHKAKKAHELTLRAIESGTNNSANKKWKRVFGRPFPSATQAITENAATTWRDTEQFIEDMHPIDIRYSLHMDCEVSQNGFRDGALREMLRRGIRLSPSKQLKFSITSCDVPIPYTLKWKVLNRGDEAKRRDEIRGQIFELWSFLVYGEIEGWRILLIDSGKNHNQQRMIRHDPVYPESAFTTRRT
ncbi:hypothetical protein MWU49_08765, partial [Alcanivorax sp. S6407]|uniref:SMODS domain-containing nucleotidyltransferase n=1 Tax=Alcanivorax sp. S6407 TaxID=2926424 RepID=UPI001FF4515E